MLTPSTARHLLDNIRQPVICQDIEKLAAAAKFVWLFLNTPIYF